VSGRHNLAEEIFIDRDGSTLGFIFAYFRDTFNVADLPTDRNHAAQLASDCEYFMMPLDFWKLAIFSAPIACNVSGIFDNFDRLEYDWGLQTDSTIARVNSGGNYGGLSNGPLTLTMGDVPQNQTGTSAVLPVVISNASGLAQCEVNGVYEPTDMLQNERVLYRKVGDHDLWLRYVSDQQWMVSQTDDKEENNTGGYAYCQEEGVMFPQDAKHWVVTDGHDWEEQSFVTVSVYEQQRPITVMSHARGAKGSMCNGVYEEQPELYNGKKLFRKVGDKDKWLRYGRERWIVSSTEAKDKSGGQGGGWCSSKEKKLASPDMVDKLKGWKVYDGKDWENQTCIQCEANYQLNTLAGIQEIKHLAEVTVTFGGAGVSLDRMMLSLALNDSTSSLPVRLIASAMPLGAQHPVVMQFPFSVSPTIEAKRASVTFPSSETEGKLFKSITLAVKPPVNQPATNHSLTLNYLEVFGELYLPRIR
jgi:hypothetical protein